MPASSQVNREHWGWKIYIYENHDIAIAMSSSSRADTDSVLAWGKGLIQCHCTGWSHLNLYIIRVIALSRCKMFKSDNHWEGWYEMVLLTHTQTDTAFIVKDSYSRCGRNNCIKAFKSTFPGEEYKVRKRIFFEHFNLICKYRFRQTACMMYLMIAAISLTSSMRIFQEDTMTITLRNRQKVFY